MSLKNYMVPTRDQKLPDGSTFAVRAITPTDITTLMSRHKETVITLFQAEIMNAKKPNFTADDINRLGTSIMTNAPHILAEVIALASDEGIEVAATVGKLPLSVQILALNDIIELTMTNEGGGKKLMETVLTTIARVVTSMTQDRLSMAGILASVAK
jgi:hypothetical protein